MSLRDDLATANRILADQGILRVFGHVSCRHPDGDKLLISRSRSPALVTAEDVLTMDFDGEVLDSDARPYGETVIHRAIYRNRADVGAVIHHHADEIIPFTGLDIPYKPVFHMGALFAEGVPVFDAFDEAVMGRLVVTEAEGERMAADLGDRRAQLIEAHGANVTGADLREAVIATVYFVMNARYQYRMELHGTPVYYDGPEHSVRAMVDDVILSDIAMDRLWEYLVSRV